MIRSLIFSLALVFAGISQSLAIENSKTEVVLPADLTANDHHRTPSLIDATVDVGSAGSLAKGTMLDAGSRSEGNLPADVTTGTDSKTLLPAEVLVDADSVDFLSLQEITHKNRIYHLGLVEEDFSFFKKLSSEEQEKFLNKRQKILAKFVSILSVTKVFVGFGAVVKNKLTFWKPEQRSISEVYRTSSHVVTEKILTEIDRQLWQTAAVVAGSNETSFVISPRLVAGLGFGSKGFVPNVGLGLAFAINHERNEFVFEIFSALGKFEKTLLPLPAIGAKLFILTGLRVSKDLVGQNDRANSELIFVPGPLVISRSQQELGFYADPGVGLSLFLMMTKVKEYKIFSFTQQLEQTAAAYGLACGGAHL